MNKRLSLVMLAGLSLLAPSVASAQSADVWTAIQQVQAEMRTDRQAVVAANVPLTEAQSQVFWPVYKEYRAEADKIGDRYAQLIVDYANRYESMDDATAESLAKQMFKIEKDRVSLREKYFKNLSKVVGASKAARAVQIESKLDTIVQLGIASEVPLVPSAKN